MREAQNEAITSDASALVLTAAADSLMRNDRFKVPGMSLRKKLQNWSAGAWPQRYFRRAPRNDPAMAGGRQLQVRAAIPCGFRRCGQTAAIIELVPKGVAYADGQQDLLHEFSDDYCSRGTFRVSQFLPYVDYSMDVPDYEAAVAAVRRAGRGGLPALLYRLNSKEYAPFFCGMCGLPYCKSHWNLRPVFDECGFDFYTGSCPVGHKHFIDH